MHRDYGSAQVAAMGEQGWRGIHGGCGGAGEGEDDGGGRRSNEVGDQDRALVAKECRRKITAGRC